MDKFFIFLYLFSTSLYADVFVATEEDFLIHMNNHVNNTGAVGKRTVELFKANPQEMRQYFSGLGDNFVITPRIEKLADEFLSVHDASKINTNPEFLKAHHTSEPGIKKLFKMYGKPMEAMEEAERKVIANQINGVDSEVRQGFMRAHRVTPLEMKFLDQLEKLADYTERGSNPVTSEELGHKALRGSEFLARDLPKVSGPEAAQLKKKIELAKRLEDLYPKVAKPYLLYKEEVLAFKSILDKMGIAEENLRNFSEVELFNRYSKSLAPGTKLSPHSVATFIFENENEFKALKSFALESAQVNSSLNLDLARAFYLKNKGQPVPPRYNQLFQVLGGECAH